MAVFKLIQGLPYGAPGDTVEMQPVDDVAHFFHYGISDAHRRKTAHAGQAHSWNYRLPGKQIQTVRVTIAEYQAKGGLIDRLLGKGVERRGQGQVVVDATLNDRPVTIILEGDEHDIQALGQQLRRLKTAIPRNVPPPRWQD